MAAENISAARGSRSPRAAWRPAGGHGREQHVVGQWFAQPQLAGEHRDRRLDEDETRGGRRRNARQSEHVEQVGEDRRADHDVEERPPARGRGVLGEGAAAQRQERRGPGREREHPRDHDERRIAREQRARDHEVDRIKDLVADHEQVADEVRAAEVRSALQEQHQCAGERQRHAGGAHAVETLLAQHDGDDHREDRNQRQEQRRVDRRRALQPLEEQGHVEHDAEQRAQHETAQVGAREQRFAAVRREGKREQRCAPDRDAPSGHAARREVGEGFFAEHGKQPEEQLHDEQRRDALAALGALFVG